MYDRLYEQMQEYGLDQIGSSAKVAVATYLLDAMEEREQDEELLLSVLLLSKYQPLVVSLVKELCLTICFTQEFSLTFFSK